MFPYFQLTSGLGSYIHVVLTPQLEFFLISLLFALCVVALVFGYLSREKPLWGQQRRLHTPLPAEQQGLHLRLPHGLPQDQQPCLCPE